MARFKIGTSIWLQNVTYIFQSQTLRLGINLSKKIDWLTDSESQPESTREINSSGFNLGKMEHFFLLSVILWKCSVLPKVNKI